MVSCVYRHCCPPGVGSIQCWMTLIWWSDVTSPASQKERRRGISSVRYKNKQICIKTCQWQYSCSQRINCYFLIFLVAGHAEVLHWFWNQWSDRKCTDSERDDHFALWQNHLTAGKNYIKWFSDIWFHLHKLWIKVLGQLHSRSCRCNALKLPAHSADVNTSGGLELLSYWVYWRTFMHLSTLEPRLVTSCGLLLHG